MVFYSVIEKNKIISFVGKMDLTRDNHDTLNNPGSEIQVSHIFSVLWILDFILSHTHTYTQHGNKRETGKRAGREEDDR